MVDGDGAGAGHGPSVSHAGSSIAPPAWLNELTVEPGPPWLHMGLRTIAEDQWLDVDERRGQELDLKRRLLAERHDEVFAAVDGTEAAGREVLGLVLADLARRHLDPAAPDANQHPLEAAGRLVQEDLCLMDQRNEVPHLVAASLCFPSHWRLADKVGRSAAAIHGPVPHYDQELRAKVDRFLERLPDGRVVLRRNWGIHDHDTLFVPRHPPSQRGVTADNAGERLWLRSERQTLRRLPVTGAVLFTIRVQVVPLGVVAGRPDVANGLAASARASTEIGHQRIPGGHLDAACRWLEATGTRGNPTGSGPLYSD